MPNHELRSDFLETFLINNCSFYFGTSSGPVGIARMLRKKNLSYKYLTFGKCICRELELPCNLQKVFVKEKKLFLSIKQIIERDVYKTVDTISLKQKSLKFIDNTKDEILDYTKEIFQYLKSNKYDFNNRYFNKKKKI